MTKRDHDDDCSLDVYFCPKISPSVMAPGDPSLGQDLFRKGYFVQLHPRISQMCRRFPWQQKSSLWRQCAIRCETAVFTWNDIVQKSNTSNNQRDSTVSEQKSNRANSLIRSSHRSNHCIRKKYDLPYIQNHLLSVVQGDNQWYHHRSENMWRLPVVSEERGQAQKILLPSPFLETYSVSVWKSVMYKKTLDSN